ncbi:hypothetical protein JSQ81_10595 [Sporosarcina sp. Marseille-Q4063]|uniref:hypothetical protein n=1 Tax=Sporosarcina sp. Marseille-Q4063 TaxID=2810514 RepID=UPI001BB0201E|nr:hypothetical protein [Sporosarcina sp. Marseille-Q4063]QUW20320.1 hypothetical protein JSQ81_10595 [Sporosarcina sp. Marseille-Q4063]
MNRFFIKHEFMLMRKSKKNNMFIVFLAALVFSYCFIVLPNQETIDTIDVEELKVLVSDTAASQESREARGATGIIHFIGMSAYAQDEYRNKVRNAMVHAYENEEYTRYLRFKILNIDPMAFMEDKTIFPKSPFPHKDRSNLLHHMQLRYDSYLTSDLPVSNEIIEQKTALQVLSNLLLSPMTYLIFFCAIYFGSDVLVRDRKNPTVLQGIPLSWYRLINLKTFVAFSYTMLVLFALFIAGMAALTFQNGFGYFGIQIPVLVPGTEIGFMDSEMISIGKFLLLAIGFIPILVYFFIRLNMVLSLVLKNEWLVLLVSSLILFSERIYFTRTLREILGVEISHFPQTYFEFGKVITGAKNFLVNLETITYSKGYLLFIIAIVITELLLVLVSRIVDKQRFYQTN